jgi:protein SCO1/2
MNRRKFLGSSAAAATALAPLALPSLAVAQAIDHSRHRLAERAERPKLHQDGVEWFTNVPVKTHDGRTFRFYDDLLKGKIVLINFFFTDCDAICPLMTENLSHVQDLLGPRVGRDIFMYSITLQPRRDTPEVLNAYAKPYGVGPGWLFLTGAPDHIELLRHRLGFVDSDPVQDADLEQHIGTVRIANEPMHRWIMAPALLKPEAIVRAVKRAIPETS